MTPDTFLFYSDFNCPFCFSLNERIESINKSNLVEWRGIQHMPAASSKNPTIDDHTQLVNEVSVIRKRAPEIMISIPSFRPNTDLANRLTYALSTFDKKLAKRVGTDIYRAYWQLGLDISEKEVLYKIVERHGGIMPSTLFSSSIDQELFEWQKEWEGELYQTRLPTLYAKGMQKPLLGFPTLDLLNHFFEGDSMTNSPESLASCTYKPKQTILLVGTEMEQRCNMTEMRKSCHIHSLPSIEGANRWLAEQSCEPDLIVLDSISLGESCYAYCSELKHDSLHRLTPILILQNRSSLDEELRAFDVGATDVVFDLTDAKICHAKLDMHLRMKRSSSLLIWLARMDYLTGLANRREFERKYEESFQHAKRLSASIAVIFIDVDHFKKYNDTYGHTAGDDCLHQVAKAIGGCVHRSTDLAARYGGEEFVILLQDTDEEGVVTVANNMVNAVRKLKLPHIASDTYEFVTISAGVATLVPSREDNPSSLLEAADAALYKAKSSGRNRALRN